MLERHNDNEEAKETASSTRFTRKALANGIRRRDRLRTDDGSHEGGGDARNSFTDVNPSAWALRLGAWKARRQRPASRQEPCCRLPGTLALPDPARLALEPH